MRSALEHSDTTAAAATAGRHARPRVATRGTMKRIAVSAASLSLLAGLAVVGSAGTASATSRVNYCGSSFGYLGSWPINDSAGAGVEGYIDVYWSGYYGENCAIARPNNGVYNPNHIDVGIYLPGHYGSSGQQDPKFGDNTTNWTHYAGPVYVKAPSCVSFYGGFFYNSPNSNYQAYGDYTSKYC